MEDTAAIEFANLARKLAGKPPLVAQRDGRARPAFTSDDIEAVAAEIDERGSAMVRDDIAAHMIGRGFEREPGGEERRGYTEIRRATPAPQTGERE